MSKQQPYIWINACVVGFFFLVSTERWCRAHRGQQLPPAGLQDHGVGGRHTGRVLCLQQDPAQGKGLRPRGVGLLLMLTSNICVETV